MQEQVSAYMVSRVARAISFHLRFLWRSQARKPSVGSGLSSRCSLAPAPSPSLPTASPSLPPSLTPLHHLSLLSTHHYLTTTTTTQAGSAPRVMAATHVARDAG